MDFVPIKLDGFDGREDSLANIKRYIHYITPIMVYRTNVLIHSRRVLWHLEESVQDILAIYRDCFNIDFARTLALVHDDLEIITGDVQLYEKERMNNDELEVLSRKEKNATKRLVEMYGSMANNYSYLELLNAAKEKNCLESQFVSFFDKFDGGGEAWHEIWAGNNYFLRPAGGSDGQRGGYIRRLREFPNKYPTMKKFFEQFPKYLPKQFDFKSAAEQGNLHTQSSLQKDSGYPPYERWKRTIIKHEGIDILTTQVEFIN